MKLIKAIILAGGKGERLSHIIKDRPKPMAIVSGRPFLEYLILNLKKQGLTEIILSIGHKGNFIKKYFGNGNQLGVNIDYVIEKQLLGTGGAVNLALKKHNLGNNFIVINGDCYLDSNYNSLISNHLKFESTATLALVKYKNPDRYGTIQVASNNQIRKFEEKKKIKGEALINAGSYVFSKKIINYFPDKENFSLETEVFPKIGGNLYGLIHGDYFIDIGVEKDFIRAQSDFSKLNVASFI